jgi:hypothetical protein
MSNPNPTPDPLLDEEFVQRLRDRLGLPNVPVQIKNERPFLSSLLGRVVGRYGEYIVCGIFALLGNTKQITDIILVPKKIEEAYHFYEPKSKVSLQAVSDYLSRTSRPPDYPAPLPPTKEFVVFGQEAVLPPGPPELVTTTTTTTTTTPPPGSQELSLPTLRMPMRAIPLSITNGPPIVLMSSALPPNSLQHFEEFDPRRDLPTWEL